MRACGPGEFRVSLVHLRVVGALGMSRRTYLFFKVGAAALPVARRVMVMCFQVLRNGSTSLGGFHLYVFIFPPRSDRWPTTRPTSF